MHRSASLSAYRGKLRLLLLYLLEDGPKYGYQLMKSIEALAGRAPGAGAVYPQLGYLRAKGLIWSRTSSEGGRRVKLYGLTESGRLFLDENRDELNQLLILLRSLRDIHDMGWADVVEAIWNLALRMGSLKPESKERLRTALLDLLEELRSLD